MTETTIRLFFTPSQKKGLLIASRKCDSVGWSGNHVGVGPLSSSSGLKALATIQ